MLAILTSNQLSVEINPNGAELSSIKNTAGTEFTWQGDKDVWPRHAPVLFPIVGKLKENCFEFNGKSYELGQHGFARDRIFTLVAGSNSACLFELQSDAESKTKYPFDFVFQVGYQLSGNTLTTTYMVKNPSPETLYFSVGAHPGFNCPLLPNERFEDYFIEFESNDYLLTQLSNGLRTDTKKALNLTQKRLFLTEALFDNDALVFENGQINSLSLCSSVSPHKITLSCRGWPYFGIWAKKGCRKFVCLEPWFGIADNVTANGNIAEKGGIIELKEGQEFGCSFSVSIA